MNTWDWATVKPLEVRRDVDKGHTAPSAIQRLQLLHPDYETVSHSHRT